jgi:hypothetical protein
MSAVRIAGFAAAAFFVAASGHTQNITDSSSSSNHASAKAGTTITGCLMKEADYRKAHDLGKGTIHGAGIGDEYVIVESSDCSSTANAMAYRPTGRLERELKPFLGQRVEVTGHMHHARDAALTSVAPGKLPPEFDVTSYRAAAAEQAANSAELPAVEPAPPAPAPPAPESTEASNAAPASPAPVATSGTLPKTAGNEPMIALIGLILLGAGIGMKMVRRAKA